MADKEKDGRPQPVDPIIKPLGDLGRYQLFVCLLVFLSKFPSGWVTLASVFLIARMKEYCAEPADIKDACDKACTKVAYNSTDIKSNAVSEFGLICNKAYLASLSQTFVMLGIMLGGIVCGGFADRYGRRRVFTIICTCQLVFGVLVSLSFDYISFCIFRFSNAFFTGGMMVVSFVCIMEIVGKSKRELMSILYQIPFNMGHATLPLFAYFLRTWQWYHFAFSIFSVTYLSYWCLLPESPRWLLTQGRTEESIAILEMYARRNGKPTEGIRADIEEAYKKISANTPTKKATMADLFRTPYLRLKTIVLTYQWLAVCMTYYGVSQYVTELSGDIFTNVAFGACLGVPGTIICVPMTKYLGRKFTIIFSNTMSAVALLAMVVFPGGTTGIGMYLATLGLFGASITFPNVYLFSGELFPTVVRNSGMGLCSFVGRVGSMISPFVAMAGMHGLWIPAVVFGISSAGAALSAFILPETKGQLLPETLEDGELFGKKKPKE